MTRQLKVFFSMWDFVGPQNACIGLGQVLLERGHKVYFVVNDKFAGKFEKYGFDVRYIKADETREEKQKDPSTNQEQDPIKKFCNELIEYGFFENKSSLEKIKKFSDADFLVEVYQKCIDYEPQLKTLLVEIKPDFLVIDSDIVPPCLLNTSVPWAFLFCSQPLGCFSSPDLPPFTSGYPTKGDRSNWAEYREVQQKFHFDEVLGYQRELCKRFNYPYDEERVYIPRSPYMTLYQYPEELDYHKDIVLPDTFVRVDAFSRDEVGAPFQLPAEFRAKIKPGDKLIYVSMGSMGSADVALMKRLVSILGQTPHRYIVSRGLLADQYELADNMYGEVYLPQTQLLPLVDLVITHGGNNSVTEAFAAGKPMIVLPLFYDQYDNAQRLQETGYGVRLNPYDFESHQLTNVIDQLLNDQALNKRLREAADRIKRTNTKLQACVAIERIAQRHSEQTNSYK